jgi:shikimate dehydrogenase
VATARDSAASSQALQQLVAVLACPAAGNPSQYLFERAAAASGLDWLFATCEVPSDMTADALAGVRGLGFRGCILAGPCRALAASCVDILSPAATFAGAVSLIERRGSELIGHITDGRGVVEALRRHADPSGIRVAVIGTGPAARASALELALAGAAGILVAGRTDERVDDLLSRLGQLGTVDCGKLPWDRTIAIPSDTDVVIAALPEAAARDIRLTSLRPDLVVADLTITGHRTPLLAQAADCRACCISGIDIHAERFAVDFKQWTGLDTDSDMLREALEEFLSA